MPAIQLDRLKLQVAEVGAHFGEPAAVVKALHTLFEFYADRTRRPGQTGEPPPLLPAYHVPPPVLRHILQELTPRLASQPEAGLQLVDALWAEEMIEHRLLGARLLGRLPLSPSEAILERVKAWAAPKQEPLLMEVLLTDGVSRLLAEASEDYLALVRDWVKDTTAGWQMIGLQALLAIVANPDFENLPFIFNLLRPLAQAAPSVLRPYLLDVVQALVRRSPQETAYFLRQALAGGLDPTPGWLIRRSLDRFPAEIRIQLKSELRQKRA